MYWQVYLHKTVVAAEMMLIHVLKRAQVLARNGKELFASPALRFFLYNTITKKDFAERDEVLEYFSELDDFDIFSAVKVWQHHEDLVLATLSRRLLHRELFKIEISKEPFSPDRIQMEKEIVRKQFDLQEDELDYFVYTDTLSNSAYYHHKQTINILMKNGTVMDITKASDHLNISTLAQPVEKFFLCFPID